MPGQKERRAEAQTAPPPTGTYNCTAILSQAAKTSLWGNGPQPEPKTTETGSRGLTALTITSDGSQTFAEGEKTDRLFEVCIVIYQYRWTNIDGRRGERGLLHHGADSLPESKVLPSVNFLSSVEC